MRIIITCLFGLLIVNSFAQSDFIPYFGDPPKDLLDRDFNALPECGFVQIYNPEAYLGATNFQDQNIHFFDNYVIEGCDPYSKLWEAPSKITAFDKNDQDTLFLATLNSGIYIYQEGSFKNISLPQQKIPDQIREIKFMNNQLIIFTSHFVYALNFTDLSLEQVFSSSDFIVDIGIDHLNQIWLKTSSGLFLNDQYLNTDQIGFEVFKLNPDQSYKRLTSDMKLDNSNNVFKIQHNLINGSSKIRFEYQLNGGPWVSDKYPILPVGQVNDGDNELIFRMRIEDNIIPAQRWIMQKRKAVKNNSLWKYLFGGLLFFAGLLSFAYVRERNLRQSFSQRISRIRAERQLVKTEQKVLQLEMNPHFLFNALNSIKGLIASGQTKEARLYLSKFGAIMRTTLDCSKQDMITLDQEVQFLNNYLSIEQMSKPDKFDYEIKVSDDIDKEHQILGMLIQPLVENAIIHGIGPKSTKGQIDIEFYKENGHIYAAISDNGIGRSGKNTSNASHKSYGLEIVKSRVNRLKGINNFSMIDLKGKNGEASGTKVLVQIA